MNTSTLRTSITAAFACVAISLGHGALADQSGPVCAPVRDVNSIFGNAAGIPPSAQCTTEPKVKAVGGTQDVATIMGNGPRYMNQSPSNGKSVVARNLRDVPVSQILGRSADPHQNIRTPATDAVARITE